MAKIRPPIRTDVQTMAEVRQALQRIVLLLPDVDPNVFKRDPRQPPPPPPPPPGGEFRWTIVRADDRYNENDDRYEPNVGELLVFGHQDARILMPEATDDNEGMMIGFKAQGPYNGLPHWNVAVVTGQRIEYEDWASRTFSPQTEEPGFYCVVLTAVSPSNDRILGGNGGWLGLMELESPTVQNISVPPAPDGPRPPRRRTNGSDGVPVGLIGFWLGSEDTIPDGWKPIAGRSIRSDDHAELMAVLGKTFGADDAQHLNLPDARGRVLVGLDNMGGTSADRVTSPQADTLGGVLGNEEVVI